MFDRRHAITVANTLNISTQTFVMYSSCLSVNLFLAKGLIRFSDMIAAGARIAALVVLIMADKSDPKNRI